MELISETLKRSLKLHRIKRTDKDRGCKTLWYQSSLPDLSLSLSGAVWTQPDRKGKLLINDISQPQWNIHLCTILCFHQHSRPGSAMSPWLCRTLPDFRIIYFMVRFGWANITHSFIDLKEEGPEGGGDFTGAAVACVRFFVFFAHVHAHSFQAFAVQ